MAALNKCMFIGYVTKDIELKYTQTGMAVCNFNIGINNTYKKNNETITETLFVKIVVWNKQAESCAQYLNKGSMVFVEGRLCRKEFEDDTGHKKSSYEITAEKVQFLDRKKNEQTDVTENHEEPEIEKMYGGKGIPF